jgi:hypothetical protein
MRLTMIRAFIRYYLKPTLANWRALRRIAMSRLPATTTTKGVES